METKTTKNSQGTQTFDQLMPDVVSLSDEEKIALLQKTWAEVQQKNRELEIEAAIDRVRTRAMTMVHSDELKSLVAVVSAELTRLDFILDRSFILTVDPATKGTTWWMSHPESPEEPVALFVQYHEQPPFLAMLRAWEERQFKWEYTLEGEVKKIWDKFLFAETELSQLPENIINSMRGNEMVYFSGSFNNFGCLWIATLSPLPGEHFDILLRFARVFDQTYTRFLDLQKAEAHAREAEIQLALERVRSRSMAMRRSEEVMDVAVNVYDELQRLSFKFGAATIIIMDEDTGFMEHWLAGFIQKNHVESYQVNNIHHPLHAAQLAGWRKGEKFLSIEFSGTALKDYAEEMFTQTGYKNLPDEEKAMLSANEYAVFNLAYMSHGALMWAPSPLTHENAIILQRFAKVFEQTYTRFLDLQKAEAQAREAKIEAALERVRSASLAMHTSDELKDVIIVVFQKLKDLGLVFEGAGIQLFTERSKDIVQWVAAPDHLAAPILAVLPYTEKDYNESEIVRDIWMAKEEGISLYNKSYSLNEKNSFFKYAGRHNDFDKIPVPVREFQMQAQSYTLSLVPENRSALWVDSYSGQTISIDGFNVLKRIAKVFEQTYIRFLDLEKAEAQAREAQIEAAMERLRSKAMGMQSSTELSDVIRTMYEEIKKADESLNRCFIMIFDKETKGVTWWMAGDDVTPTNNAYYISYSNHPPQLAYLRGWEEQQEKWQYIMEGREKKDWDAFLFHETDLAKLPPVVIESMKSFEKIYLNASFKSFGCLTTGAIQPLSDEAFDILIRFAKVFDLIYTRFNDLKQAEAQAREAKIEAALEKIRSRSLAMHHSNELISVIAVMFEKAKELNVLLGTVAIWLFDSATMDSVFWVGNDWQQPAMVNLPYDEQMMKEDTNYKDSWQAWISGESYINKEYSKEQKDKYFRYVFAHNDEVAIPPPAREMLMKGVKYIACLLVEKNSTLYFDCWHGATYKDESVEVLKRVAKVFEQAYVRFLDLQKAEALALRAEEDLIAIKVARKKAEDALTELRSTQAQLIQKEKMASLGELTAGIAHEIQNPLNFVNNFSEINTELIEELKSEKSKLKSKEFDELLNDIAENEQKINQHGKRADAIVKGMLQHSRASTGKREPTDINALADEYLRLSYHGLRAKDKEFNANFKTDFDENIGKIEVAPQDIGRVLLNLYNNAFYSISQKKAQLNGAFEPAVSVSTKRIGDKVEISVKDNGTGIPQKVLDKIYQPFFTTKPAGQGTGLGLSLSFDIIRAHGGELKVETKEGKGAEFIIVFPSKENIKKPSL